jgi:hypothetical protein
MVQLNLKISRTNVNNSAKPFTRSLERWILLDGLK